MKKLISSGQVVLNRTNSLPPSAYFESRGCQIEVVRSCNTTYNSSYDDLTVDDTNKALMVGEIYKIPTTSMPTTSESDTRQGKFQRRDSLGSYKMKTLTSADWCTSISTEAAVDDVPSRWSHKALLVKDTSGISTMVDKGNHKRCSSTGIIPTIKAAATKSEPDRLGKVKRSGSTGHLNRILNSDCFNERSWSASDEGSVKQGNLKRCSSTGTIPTIETSAKKSAPNRLGKSKRRGSSTGHLDRILNPDCFNERPWSASLDDGSDNQGNLKRSSSSGTLPTIETAAKRSESDRLGKFKRCGSTGHLNMILNSDCFNERSWSALDDGSALDDELPKIMRRSSSATVLSALGVSDPKSPLLDVSEPAAQKSEPERLGQFKRRSSTGHLNMILNSDCFNERSWSALDDELPKVMRRSSSATVLSALGVSDSKSPLPDISEDLESGKFRAADLFPAPRTISNPYEEDREFIDGLVFFSPSNEDSVRSMLGHPPAK